MNRIILTACFFVLAVSAKAQLGISAGMNISRYSYAEKLPDEDRKAILAYNFGLQYKKQLNEKLFLLPELSYTQKGTQVYYSYPIGYTGPMKNVNTLSYLQLTLPGVLAFPLSDEYDFEIGAGPYVAYLMKTKQKTEEFEGTSNTKGFAKGAFTKMDAGLYLTTGLRLGKKLGTYFRYDLGLTNINGTSGGPSVKNRNFSIGINWIFAESD